MSKLYVGSICGTSLDGIDVALVEFPSASSARVINYASAPLGTRLSTAMRAIVFNGATCDALTYGQLDQQFGIAIAKAINELLQSNSVSSDKITAIGSHGINLLHAPDEDIPVTLQIGDPNQIVRLTGITTVADFRRRDVALGGQGAPLAPAFHACVFADRNETRVVLNLGGIANITVLKPGEPVIGFDTGPANGLLDAWYVEHHPNNAPRQTDSPTSDNTELSRVNYDAFDRNGHWASGGGVNQTLLKLLASDDYFSRPAPKSTGKEHFNYAWLKKHMRTLPNVPNTQDVQATLAELTARTVCASIRAHAPNVGSLLVCGGGAHNDDIIERLRAELPGTKVATTETLGVAPDHVEAAAFAWLAKRTLAHESGNVSSVTGASADTILGGVYFT